MDGEIDYSQYNTESNTALEFHLASACGDERGMLEKTYKFRNISSEIMPSISDTAVCDFQDLDLSA